MLLTQIDTGMQFALIRLSSISQWRCAIFGAGGVNGAAFALATPVNNLLL
jgi:hypothetical protein